MNEPSHRARSRSPTKRRPGFRWKEKRRDDDNRDGDDERLLERGYRDRSPRKRDTDGEERKNDEQKEKEHKERKKEKKRKKAVAATQSSEPMIVVNVNDRLGTKAAIPCLASDPISLSSPSYFSNCCRC